MPCLLEGPGDPMRLGRSAELKLMKNFCPIGPYRAGFQTSGRSVAADRRSCSWLLGLWVLRTFGEIWCGRKACERGREHSVRAERRERVDR